ncbi:unnamed protein product [Brassicogethes aeneus]|uniref:Microtubule-associated protein Jupiter n=1 Tax=Brassicogethes aeneus TaxID=1431903 RepID=A0A9P0FFC4_BRAAE|nr:unnamed protein product [Brassicogethes aeneus]
MTSTNYNVGLTDGRNSSRVLRPPGGGHTPLFEAAEPLVARKDNGRNASSITEGRSEPKAAPQQVTTPTEAPAAPTSNAAPTVTPVSAVAPTAPVAPVAASQRARVPPGGFSSGLW